MQRELGLCERDAELARLDGAVAAMFSGEASVAVVRGAAGIGKSSLLEIAGARAHAGGALVLRARGGVMECDLVFGVVAQLLERTLLDARGEHRRALLSGPARLAEVALHAGAGERSDGYEQGMLNHGLYWLVVNLVEQGPLMLVVDDAHWADPASLAFLLYLVRRRSGHPLTILIAARSDETQSPDLLQPILLEPGVDLIEPSALTASAAAQVLTA